MQLKNEEKQLLEQYKTLSNSTLNIANRLAVEVVPPIVFVVTGIIRDEIIWFLLLITIMVFYNVQRVIRQQRNLTTLKSLSDKLLNEKGDASVQ
jgi:hypothetical protein